MRRGFSIVGVAVRPGETVAQIIKRRIQAWIDGGRQGDCWIGHLYGFYETKGEAVDRLEHLRAEEARGWVERIQTKYRIVKVYEKGGRPVFDPSL